MGVEEIRAYLNNTMSSDKRQQFESALKQDSDLASEFQQYKAIKEFVTDSKLLELKEKMKLDLASRSLKKPYKKIVGFSIVALVSIGFFFYYFLPAENNTEYVKPEKRKVEKNLKPSIKKEAPEVIVKEEETPEPDKSNTMVERITSIENPEPEVVDTLEVVNIEPQVMEEETVSVNQILIETPKTIDPCIAINFQVEYSIEPACKNQSDGKATILSVSGGKEPYMFKFGGSAYTNEKEFEALAAGPYTLEIVDGNGCQQMHQERLIVGSKICNEVKEYSFSPGYGEVWKYPIQGNSNLKVFNMAGQLVYESEDDLQFVWTGQDLAGKNVESGVYLFVISGSEKNEQGYISVIR